MRIIALIPARAGSKRIINKNLQQINGVPLLGLAIKQAFDTELIQEVYVSTENEVYAEIAKSYGAEVPFLRPAELASDTSTDYDVFRHFLKWYKEDKGEYPDLIVQVRATAPLRKSEDINKAIKMIMKDEEADSLRTVSIPHQTPYKMWKIDETTNYLTPIIERNGEGYDGPTQILPKAYAQDGVVDIIKCKTILNKKSMAGDKILGYTKHDITWDIDNPLDLKYIELLMNDKSFLKLNNNSKCLGSNLGIIQGRLTESKELQHFPDNWKNEFELARKAGYTYIELIRDINYNDKNPLWNEEINLEEIKKVSLESGIATRIICDDYIQNCDWCNLSLDQYDNILKIVSKANKLQIKNIVFPLFKKANIDSMEREEKFIYYMKKIIKIAENLNVNIYLEMSQKSEKMIRVMEKINSENIGICFDTGNLIAEGFVPEQILEDKELFKYIKHVHIKDRDSEKNNVVLGKGHVKFKKVIKQLIDNNYIGNLTTETDRGKNPIETAITNKEFLKNIIKGG